MKDICSAFFDEVESQELGKANTKPNMEYDRKVKHFTVDKAIFDFFLTQTKRSSPLESGKKYVRIDNGAYPDRKKQ